MLESMMQKIIAITSATEIKQILARAKMDMDIISSGRALFVSKKLIADFGDPRVTV